MHLLLLQLVQGYRPLHQLLTRLGLQAHPVIRHYPPVLSHPFFLADLACHPCQMDLTDLFKEGRCRGNCRVQC